MRTTANYRASADECQRLARSARSEEQRQFLKELANTWISLAERNERIEQVGLNAVEDALVRLDEKSAEQPRSH